MSICSCHDTELTGFDDVRFEIAADDRSGVYSDFVPQMTYAEEHIPYSNITITERTGVPAATVTWTLRFGCKHHYHAFLARLGTVGTLRVLAGFVSAKGVEETLGNPPRVYENLDQTLLKYVAGTARMVGGSIESEATFQRAFDPVTRGAVVS